MDTSSILDISNLEIGKNSTKEENNTPIKNQEIKNININSKIIQEINKENNLKNHIGNKKEKDGIKINQIEKINNIQIINKEKRKKFRRSIFRYAFLNKNIKIRLIKYRKKNK